MSNPLPTNQHQDELREGLKRDLDVLHTVNHQKGERPDLYGEMNLIDLYVEKRLADRSTNEQLAAADRERAVARAGYDELETLLVNTYAVEEEFVPLGVVRTRMAELEAQLTPETKPEETV